MNFNFYELIKLKKDPFYRPIKNLLKFTPKSLKYYKSAFTHRSSNKKDLNTEFVVDGDGNAYLSRLEKIYVKGLTINELKDILNIPNVTFINLQYSQF